MMLSLFWIPLAISVLVLVWAFWPRYDGGNIPYNLMLISAIGPGGIDLHWYILGAVFLPWCVWGILVTIF